MSPLTLTLILITIQAIALVTAVRTMLWRTVPAWTFYLFLGTIHIAVGTVARSFGTAYPIALLYFEPAFILAQIAFTFESTVKRLGTRLRSGAPESWLIVWLVPLVPAAIVLPIEIGFLREALANWQDQRAESLHLVYVVRLCFSLTLLVILMVVPGVARLNKRAVKPAISFHHRIVTAYMACAVAGYACKYWVTQSADLYLTILFFILGPLICFLLWTLRMWKCRPEDLQPVEPAPPDDTSSAFARIALQNS